MLLELMEPGRHQPKVQHVGSDATDNCAAGSSCARAVLLVEDEPLVAISLADSLEAEGFLVSISFSGHEALDYLARPTHFDAVVSDIRLGGGPDGWTVGEAARAKFPGIALVYITADSQRDYKAYGLPDTTIVQKPFPIALLVNLMSELVE